MFVSLEHLLQFASRGLSSRGSHVKRARKSFTPTISSVGVVYITVKVRCGLKRNCDTVFSNHSGIVLLMSVLVGSLNHFSLTICDVFFFFFCEL